MVVQILLIIRQTDFSYGLLLLCLLIALVIIVASFRKRETLRVIPATISFSLILTAFVVEQDSNNLVHTPYSTELVGMQ